MSPKIEKSKETIPIVPRSKYSKKAFFSYSFNESSFQIGYLGADKSTIEGILSLRYSDEKPIFAKKIKISFVGKEYVFFQGKLEEGQNVADDDESGIYDDDQEVSTTTTSTHTAKRSFFTSNLTLWRAQSKGHYEGIKFLDLPFKFNLPDNLPPSVLMDNGCGRIYYMLKAVISRSPIDPNSRELKKIVKVVIPVVRFTIIPNPEPYRWSVKNEGPAKPHVVGYEVSTTRSVFGPGESVVIPIKLFFHEPQAYLKRVFIGLKEYHELRTDRYETSTKRYIFEETIKADMIQTPSSPDNECFIEVKFNMPSERQLAYSVDSTYLSVSHKLKFKIFLGRAPDIHLSKTVKVEKIVSEDEVFPPLPTPTNVPVPHPQENKNLVVNKPIMTMIKPVKPKRESLRRLTPFFPLFDKLQNNDPSRKQISVKLKQIDKKLQLQLQITDPKDPDMIYNSRSLLIPADKYRLQSATRRITQAH